MAHVHATHSQPFFVMTSPFMLQVLFSVPFARVVSRIQQSSLWLATPWLPLALLGASMAPAPIGTDFVCARTAKRCNSCCSSLTKHHHDRIAFAIMLTMI